MSYLPNIAITGSMSGLFTWYNSNTSFALDRAMPVVRPKSSVKYCDCVGESFSAASSGRSFAQGVYPRTALQQHCNKKSCQSCSVCSFLLGGLKDRRR